MKKTILTSLVCASLMAQEAFVLQEQVVTATHLIQDELSYAAPVEIYTQDDIKNAKPKDIYDFLNQETSLISMPTFGNQFSQKIDIRGFGIENGNQNIVVVLNGRRMNNIDTVPQLLSSIPVDSIEKIEILKGAGVVEYGDGATAGVINITTKDNTGLSFKTYAGSFKTGYASLSAGYSDDLISLSAFGDYFETAGQRDLNAGQKDSADSRNGSLDAKIYPSDELELRLGYSLSKIETNYAGSLSLAKYNQDPSQAGTGDNLQFYDTNLFSSGLSYNINKAFSFDINIFIEDKTSEYSTTGYKSAATYDYNSGDMSIKYLSDDIKLVFGSSIFNGSRHTVADFASTSDVSKDNISGFLKADYLINNHNITAGLRVEKVSYNYKDVTGVDLEQDDTLTAYELGYNYKLNKNQALFASYAHAFQSPDIDRFFAITYPAPTFSPVVSFNGFLNPMKSDTYNLGYNYFNKQNKFKATAFYINLQDEIHLDPVTFTNTNLDKSSKLGLELYDKYLILENLYLSANYTYVDARVEEDKGLGVKDTILPGVSKHNLSTNVGYAPTEESKFILSHTYRSQAYALNDFSNNFLQKQDSYNATDISASYAFEDLEVFAKIQNLFDQNNGLWIQDDAIYPINFQRAFQIGLSGSF